MNVVIIPYVVDVVVRLLWGPPFGFPLWWCVRLGVPGRCFCGGGGKLLLWTWCFDSVFRLGVSTRCFDSAIKMCKNVESFFVVDSVCRLGVRS